MRAFTFSIVIGMISLSLACGGTNLSSPKGTVESFYASFQKGDIKSAHKTLSNEIKDKVKLEDLLQEMGGKEDKEIMDKAFKKLSYKIKDVKQEGDQATVSSEINLPDLSQFFQEMLTMAFSALGGQQVDEKKMKDKMSSLIENAKMVAVPVEIKLVKEGSEWHITNDFESLIPIKQLMGGDGANPFGNNPAIDDATNALKEGFEEILGDATSALELMDASE